MRGRESEEAVWQRVSHNHRQKDGQNGSCEGSISKFYVANIPDGCRPWDLADVMKSFGVIAGVFIARKRNKEGFRFGFVSFKNVNDPKVLEKDLQQVKMGKWSLKINIAWHARENGDLKNPSGGNQPPRINPNPRTVVHRGSDSVMTKKGYSFSDAVRGSSSGPVNEVVIPIDDNFMGMSSFLNRALVSKCSSFEVVTSLFSSLCDSNYGVLSLHYLGGMFMLLDFSGEEEAKRFLEDKRVWKDWFSMVEVWRGQSLPFERIAWVGIYGIPIHLISSDIVNRIGADFGKVVKQSVAKEDEGNKALQGVGLLVGDGAIVKKTVSLKWRNKLFKVWVEENRIDWSPPVGAIKHFASPNVFRSTDDHHEDLEEGELHVSDKLVHGEDFVQRKGAVESGSSQSPCSSGGGSPEEKNSSPVEEGVEKFANETSTVEVEKMHGDSKSSDTFHGKHFSHACFVEDSFAFPKRGQEITKKRLIRKKKKVGVNDGSDGNLVKSHGVVFESKGGVCFNSLWANNVNSPSNRPKKRSRNEVHHIIDTGLFSSANVEIPTNEYPINDIVNQIIPDEGNVSKGAPIANSDEEIQKEIASLFEDSSGEHDGEGPDGEHDVAFEHGRDDLVEENFTHLDEQVTTIHNEVTNSEVEQADMNQDPELLSEVRGTMDIGNLLQMNMEGFEALIQQAIIRERQSSCPPQHPTGY